METNTGIWTENFTERTGLPSSMPMEAIERWRLSAHIKQTINRLTCLLFGRIIHTSQQGPTMASLKSAIRAKCKDCTYDQLAGGTYLQQIEDCRITRCPLWPVRPMTVATITKQRKVRTDNTVDITALVEGLDDEIEQTEDQGAI